MRVYRVGFRPGESRDRGADPRLQKTMVVVEGLARKLDPQLNMWSTAEPVVGARIADNLNPPAGSTT